MLQLEKRKGFSPDVQRELAGIIKYARLIRQCMQTDPRDVEPATRFLQRYLPAVEEIISKAQSLSQQLAKHGTDQKVQKQSLRILQALHSAFRQKHAQRLENDETEFNTEVSTLEKLLKTDGFLWRNAAES